MGGDKPDKPPKPAPAPSAEPREKTEKFESQAKRRRITQSKQSGLLSTAFQGESEQEQSKKLLGK